MGRRRTLRDGEMTRSCTLSPAPRRLSPPAPAPVRTAPVPAPETTKRLRDIGRKILDIGPILLGMEPSAAPDAKGEGHGREKRDAALAGGGSCGGATLAGGGKGAGRPGRDAAAGNAVASSALPKTFFGSAEIDGAIFFAF